MSQKEKDVEQLNNGLMPAKEPEQADFSQLASLEGFLRMACKTVHKANAKWWLDLHTGEPMKRNVGELLCLIHSEISEAMEGHRKNLMDDKLPKRPMIEAELADAIIRIMDLSEGLGLDVAGAWRNKMEYNAIREDHSIEHRLGEHGKKY